MVFYEGLSLEVHEGGGQGPLEEAGRPQAANLQGEELLASLER